LEPPPTGYCRGGWGSGGHPPGKCSISGSGVRVPGGARWRWRGMFAESANRPRHRRFCAASPRVVGAPPPTPPSTGGRGDGGPTARIVDVAAGRDDWVENSNRTRHRRFRGASPRVAGAEKARHVRGKREPASHRCACAASPGAVRAPPPTARSKAAVVTVGPMTRRVCDSREPASPSSFLRGFAARGGGSATHTPIYRQPRGSWAEAESSGAVPGGLGVCWGALGVGVRFWVHGTFTGGVMIAYDR